MSWKWYIHVLNVALLDFLASRVMNYRHTRYSVRELERWAEEGFTKPLDDLYRWVSGSTRSLCTVSFKSYFCCLVLLYMVDICLSFASNYIYMLIWYDPREKPNKNV